jgi:adenosine kinase
MDKPQIIVAGSIAIDRIMSFNGRYKDLIEPAKLHVLSVSVLVDSAVTARGGTGADIAYNLACLGEKPILLGSVGPDGGDYLEWLAGKGIDTGQVHKSELGTASFNVLNDGGGNQVGGFDPGAMSDSDSLSLDNWKGQNIIFWQAAHDPTAMRRLIEECVQNNIKLAYDPGQQVNNLPGEDLRAGVEAAGIVILNEYELELLASKTGLDIDEIKAKTPLFITTFGENGSEIAGKDVGEPIKIEAVKPAEVVDPTGAGDAYRGGFLYGYLRQWDLKKSGQLGSVVASFILEQTGPLAELSLPAIAERYKQNFNEEIEF